MSQVEIVALWVGLIGSVVGIVLSVVAIVFTWVVNRRADAVTSHTIQSLQKIESAVESLSSNSNALIKAAWDKMLGSVGSPIEPSQAITSKEQSELAAGIAAEIREELGIEEDGTPEEAASLSNLQQSLARLEAAVQTSTAIRSKANRFSELIDMILPTLRDLSPEAQELIGAIRSRHLTATQYRSIRASVLGSAMAELRDAGLLSPHMGYEGDKQTRVYFIPNGLHYVIDAAIALLPTVPQEIKDKVRDELVRVGYHHA